MQTEALQIDPFAYRKALGHFTSGVTVITTAIRGAVHGMTANAFCSVSLDPPLVLISIDKKAHMHGLLVESSFYGVSVLAQNQEAYSRHFAGQPQENLPVLFTWRKNCPLLEGALAQLVCQVTDVHPAGDHSLYIGQVEYLSYSDEQPPLLFYSGKYKALEGQAVRPVFIYDPSWW